MTSGALLTRPRRVPQKWIMEKCGATVGGACRRPATWRQDVHAGMGDKGRFIYHAYWCDEHTERITEKRRVEWGTPPKMVKIATLEEK